MDRRIQPVLLWPPKDPLIPCRLAENPLPHLPFSPPPGGRCISPLKNAATFQNNLSTLTAILASELVYVAIVEERGVNGKKRFARVGGQRC